MELAARHHEAFDRFLTTYLRDAGVAPRCRVGCTFCCYGWVEASLGEAERVLAASDDRIRRRVYREGRLRADELARWKNDPRLPERHFLSGRACPFLRDGRCAVYDARPLACRAVLTDLDPRYCVPGATMRLSGRERARYRAALDPRRHGPEHYLRLPKEVARSRFARLLDEEAKRRGFTLAGELSVLAYLLLEPSFRRAQQQGPGAVRSWLGRRGILGGRYGVWLRLKPRR